MQMQVASSAEAFDAVVVGSGATGGWAAKKLTAAGMRVALLEAGAKVTPRDFTEHTPTWQMPFLGYSPEIRKTLGMEKGGDVAVFGEIRRKKDSF